MSTTEDLEKLAEICLATAKTIKEHLASNNLPQPTFHQDGPSFFPKMGQDAEYARLQLRTASKMLYDLASGPDEAVGNHVYYCLHDINAYRYVLQYKIADHLHANETITYAKLAARSQTNERQLKKMVRQLLQLHVFTEPTPGYVSHSAASKLLNHNGLSAYAGYQVFDNLPLVERQIQAIEKWGHGSEEQHESAGNIYYGNARTTFANYQDHPDTLARFSDLMTWIASWEIFNMSHAKAGYDWAALGDATIVDIGGNMGHCCVALADAAPTAKFIVQDLPQVIARATDPAVSVVPDKLHDRISFMEHDFYAPQPIVGADVYYMRMIMHDYSDKYCKKILQAILPAMRSNSRIIVMDQILPVHGTVPAPIERLGRSVDLHMMLLTNATERERSEWDDVFTSAHPKLKIKSVAQPPGAMHAIIEVILEDAPDRT